MQVADVAITPVIAAYPSGTAAERRDRVRGPARAEWTWRRFERGPLLGDGDGHPITERAFWVRRVTAVRAGIPWLHDHAIKPHAQPRLKVDKVRSVRRIRQRGRTSRVAILTDAELILGLSRHLPTFQMDANRAAFENLELGGQTLDLAFRLRRSVSNTPARVEAIGLDAGISPRLLKTVLHTLEQLGWLAVNRDNEGRPTNVDESVPEPRVVVQAAPRLLRILLVTPVELAALGLLRLTTLLPVETRTALHEVTQLDGVNGSSEVAEKALRHLAATLLVRRVMADDGREVVYNPNVWTQGDSIAQAALRAADARATREVSALLEEVADKPGIPAAHVTACEERWVRFAISQGLVEQATIQTALGEEQHFLFTPHVARDPFGGTAGDASGQVRQLVGSMVYATTFAKYKLHSPDVFLRALRNRGVAGNTENIGTDYTMLEKAGIVRVVPGRSSGRFSMELLQDEIAEEALTILTRSGGNGGTAEDATVLRGQQSFVHAEKNRARLALSSETDKIEEARLLAALRQVPNQRARGQRP